MHLRSKIRKAINYLAFFVVSHFCCGIAYVVFAQTFLSKQTIEGEGASLLEIELSIAAFLIAFLILNEAVEYLCHTNLIKIRFIFLLSICYFSYLIVFKT